MIHHVIEIWSNIYMYISIYIYIYISIYIYILLSPPLVLYTIVIQNMTLNYAHKDNDPVNEIKFFKDFQSDVAYLIPKSSVSLLIPDVFQERYLRVFVKKSDKVMVAAATEGWFGHSLYDAVLTCIYDYIYYHIIITCQIFIYIVTLTCFSLYVVI